jgi:hypothetical protein
VKSNMRGVIRKVKDKKTRAYSRLLVRWPSVIAQYNRGMGGTDLGDQKLSYYLNAMRRAKWQIRVFIHLFQMAALNAHILYRMHHRLKASEKGYRYKHFLEALIQQLCAHKLPECTSGKATPSSRSTSGKVTPSSRSKKRAASSPASKPRIIKHQRQNSFKEAEINRLTAHHPTLWKGNQRPHCKDCKAKTSYSCSACKVGMCLISREEGGPTCWEKLHT